jgi:hypothetical protein
VFLSARLKEAVGEEERTEKSSDVFVIFEFGFSRFSDVSSGADSALVSSSQRGGIESFR